MIKPPVFHHVAFFTSEMGASIRKWQNTLSASLELPRTYIAADDVDICFLSVDGARVELVQPRDQQRARQRAQGLSGHPDHVCYMCDDFDERIARVRDEGGIVLRPPVHSEVFDARMCFVLYPGLGVIEWVEK